MSGRPAKDTGSRLISVGSFLGEKWEPALLQFWSLPGSGGTCLYCSPGPPQAPLPHRPTPLLPSEPAGHSLPWAGTLALRVGAGQLFLPPQGFWGLVPDAGACFRRRVVLPWPGRVRDKKLSCASVAPCLCSPWWLPLAFVLLPYPQGLFPHSLTLYTNANLFPSSMTLTRLEAAQRSALPSTAPATH